MPKASPKLTGGIGRQCWRGLRAGEGRAGASENARNGERAGLFYPLSCWTFAQDQAEQPRKTTRSVAQCVNTSFVLDPGTVTSALPVLP